MKKNIKFLEIYLPLYFFLSQYQLPFSTIGTVILIVYALFSFFKNRNNSINIYFLIISVASLMIKVLQFAFLPFDSINYLTSFFNIISFLLIVSYCNTHINIRRMFNVYLAFGYLCSAVLFVQSYFVYILKTPIPSIRLLPTDDLSTWYLYSNRPLSLFKEPQAFCTFIFPLLSYCSLKKKWIPSLVFATSILFSGSTTGVFLVLLTVLFIIFVSKIDFKYKLIAITSLIIATLFFTNSTLFEESFRKMTAIGTNNSDFSRLFKSYYTFVELPLQSKILGFGEYNLVNYINEYNYSFSWMAIIDQNSGVYSYQTSFFGVFVENGIVFALIFYLILLVFFFKKCKSHFSKLVFIAYLAQSVSSTFYFNSAFYFYFLIIFCFENGYFNNYTVHEAVSRKKGFFEHLCA